VPLVPLVPSQVAAALQPSSGGRGWAFSKGWTASQASPTAVVLSRLPAATPAEIKASQPPGHRPLLVRDPAAYAAGKRTPTKSPLVLSFGALVLLRCVGAKNRLAPDSALFLFGVFRANPQKGALRWLRWSQ